MPQLDLYGPGPRTAVVWRYSIDPLKPNDPAMFYVAIEGPRSLAVEHGLCFVPLSVVHEAVAELLTASWDAYLFGEVDDVRQATGRVIDKWRREATTRPQL